MQRCKGSLQLEICPPSEGKGATENYFDQYIHLTGPPRLKGDDKSVALKSTVDGFSKTVDGFSKTLQDTVGGVVELDAMIKDVSETKKELYEKIRVACKKQKEVETKQEHLQNEKDQLQKEIQNEKDQLQKEMQNKKDLLQKEIQNEKDQLQKEKDQLQKEMQNKKDLLQKEIQNAKDQLQKEKDKLQKEIQNEKDQLQKEKVQLQNEIQRMSEMNTICETRIKLDIGGHVYTTSTLTLTRDPQSMLAAMFSGRHSVKKEEDGSYFIDRDGTHFCYILNYLRDGGSNDDMLPTDRDIQKKLLREAEYYQLSGLVDLLKRD